MLLPVLFNLNTNKIPQKKTQTSPSQHCSDNKFYSNVSNDFVLPSFKSSILTFMQMQMKDKSFSFVVYRLIPVGSESFTFYFIVFKAKKKASKYF